MDQGPVGSQCAQWIGVSNANVLLGLGNRQAREAKQAACSLREACDGARRKNLRKTSPPLTERIVAADQNRSLRQPCSVATPKIQLWARSVTLATSGRSSRPKLAESFHARRPCRAD